MTPLLPPSDLERAREIVARRLGLEIAERDLPTLGELLVQRIGAVGAQGARGYLDLLAAGNGGQIGRAHV